MPVNVEIKARCADPDRVRSVLNKRGARRHGLDHQIDTYFGVSTGRLKLRRGEIENSLIYYRRPDGEAPKRSDVSLSRLPDSKVADSLRKVLSDALGTKIVIDKQREIYFHENVKFHVDDVAGLGSFVEIEVIEWSGDADEEAMLATCRTWMDRLGIQEGHLLANSYSDMLER